MISLFIFSGLGRSVRVKLVKILSKTFVSL